MSGRKILHPLQAVANNQHLLVGGNGFIRLSKKGNSENNLISNDLEVLKDNKGSRAESEGVRKKSRKGKNGKYLENEQPKHDSQLSDSNYQQQRNDRLEEEKLDSKSNEQSQETKNDVEVVSWMTSEVAPEGYWKALAEERRIALEESLKENEALHSKLAAYEKENDKLKKALEEVVEEAKQLIEINEELTKEIKN